MRLQSSLPGPEFDANAPSRLIRSRVVEAPERSDAPSPRRLPTVRLRRDRSTHWSRRLVAEHRLGVDDLIWPLFVIEGRSKRVPIASMPGVERLSVDN